MFIKNKEYTKLGKTLAPIIFGLFITLVVFKYTTSIPYVYLSLTYNILLVGYGTIVLIRELMHKHKISIITVGILVSVYSGFITKDIIQIFN